MQLRSKKTAPVCHINIAPLIDVVFLLIIFFMTVTQLNQVHADKLSLPEVSQGDLPLKNVPLKIIVNVQADGRIIIKSQFYSHMSFDGLLAEKLQVIDPQNITVLIRGDRKSAWQSIAEIMRICSSRGIADVRVAVLETGGAGVEL